MTDGYERARGRRNFLERLGEKIPGYRGFQDRELRRDVDKLQREHLAGRVSALRAEARRLAGRYTDAGQLGALQPFDRLDRRLDGLERGIRFSDYGVTGLFDAVKVGEAELEHLYELDLSVVDDLDAAAAALAAVPAPGAGDPRPALEGVLTQVGRLEEKWAGRRSLVSDVVRS